jgi:hypothetical protein
MLPTQTALEDAMPDDDVPELHQPDADRVYRNHLEHVRRCGVEPGSRERARKLIQEWTETIAASVGVPPITH